MSTPLYVGVDLGGTNIRVGSVTAEGPYGEVSRAEQGGLSSAGEVLGLAQGMVRDLLARSTGSLAGIGLSVTGPVDLVSGIVDNPWTLPRLTGIDVRRPFEERFGVPVVLENDADAAGLGEFFHGAGAGADSLATVTVGTGIGVALVRNGSLLRGSHGYHQEAGHHAISASGPTCYCGLTGCWEQLASASALEREAAAAIDRGRWAPQREIASARDVLATADAGDPVALRLVDELGVHLGRGLRNIEAFYAPELIVLGGGLGQRLDLLAAGIESGRTPASTLNLRAAIVGSGLGDGAGAIGAACAVRERLAG